MPWMAVEGLALISSSTTGCARLLALALPVSVFLPADQLSVVPHLLLLPRGLPPSRLLVPGSFPTRLRQVSLWQSLRLQQVLLLLLLLLLLQPHLYED
jgi:hypothetical protein